MRRMRSACRSRPLRPRAPPARGPPALASRGLPAARTVTEPDKLSASVSLGLRVSVPLDGVARTGLDGFGSRVDRKILVKLPDLGPADAVTAAAPKLRAAIPEASGVRVQTYADAQPA